MKVRWTPRALAQLEAIHAYIAVENRAAAAKVIAGIRNTAAMLADFPAAGEQTDRGDVRTILAWPYRTGSTIGWYAPQEKFACYAFVTFGGARQGSGISRAGS
jgi:toxin ParE1/3/4